MLTNPEKIKNLVFSGGSVRGLAYVGALKELENVGVSLERIENVAGTSAGAITALMVSMGCNADDCVRLEEVLSKEYYCQHAIDKTSRKTAKALSGPSIFKFPAMSKAVPKGAMSLMKNYGVADTAPFMKWFDDLIFEKIRKRDLTFAELAEIIKSNPELHLKNLIVTGMNLNTGETQIFSVDVTPDALISDAVRISMCIPGLFQPLRFRRKPSHGVIHYDEKKHYFVDGGVLDNYPLWVFDDKPEESTLGFRLVDKDHKDYFEGLADTPTTEISNFIAFMKALYQGLQNAEDARLARTPKDKARTIFIDTVDVSTFNFGYTDEDKHNLIVSGEVAIRNAFSSEVSLIPS